MTAEPHDDAFEQAPCGLLRTAQDGTITRVNRVFCDWLDLAPEDLVGRRLQELFGLGGRLFYQTHWAPHMRQSGSVSEVKIDVLNRTGERVPMLFNASQRQRGDASFIDVAAMVVRDRQKYERELVVARNDAVAAQQDLKRENDRKDEFLATLAHELRNPLAPLMNGVSVLKRPGISADTLARLVDIFDRQVHQLARLLDDLLEVSRITRGKLVLREERCDLRAAIQDAIDAAMPAIVSASHAFHCDLPAQPVMLRADAARLTQMVLNLLDNAARFTPAGGEIWLGVDVADNVSISVRDSGIGIPAENLAWIFETFSQVDPAVQRVGGGLGIGLALVKGLAELHGGSIRAESAGAGCGSVFTLTLPLPDADGDDTAPQRTVAGT